MDHRKVEQECHYTLFRLEEDILEHKVHHKNLRHIENFPKNGIIGKAICFSDRNSNRNYTRILLLFKFKRIEKTKHEQCCTFYQAFLWTQNQQSAPLKVFEVCVQLSKRKLTMKVKILPFLTTFTQLIARANSFYWDGYWPWE